MTMAINVTIAKGYAWRMIIIGAVSVVLGAWGVYDYAVDIPQRQMLHERAELLTLSKDALETEQAAGSLTPEATMALEAVTAEMEQTFRRELGKTLDPEQAAPTAELQAELQKKFAEVMQTSEDAEWLALLGVISQGLYAERRLPLTEQDYPLAFLAFDATRNQLDAIGQVTAPGKYDRLTQWAFIACLPFAPYFFGMYFVAKRRRYTLDDDGTLHTPAGTWQADEIADIDMNRWMAKSIAWVVPRDGARVKLDDYKFKGLHQIVGAIASRLYPDDWDKDARPAEQAEVMAETDDEALDPGDPARGHSEPAAEADAR
ncbi:MAG: hypothetical protein ACYTA3_06190 [Planctomycetota bacterium]|jgi:hypothetical protein